MKLSIVIPNYNGLHLLQKHLPYVIKYSEGAEIVIVDDGSSDESVKYLKKTYPQIKIIEKLFNDGFATTVNLGVKSVTNEIFLLFNSDILPKKGYLSPLTKHFIDPKIFAVGCMDKSYEKNQVVLRGRGIGKFQQGLLVHARGEINKTDTLWVNGGSSAFRKSIWEELGGMDMLFNPFYWDDIDLSYRAVKSGYKIIFEPTSIVEHHHQKGAILTNYSKKDIEVISYRNQLIFIWKNITDQKLLFEHLLFLPKHLLSALLKLNFSMIKGFLQALLKYPKILSHKKISQKLFIKTDQEIFKKFEKEYD